VIIFRIHDLRNIDLLNDSPSCIRLDKSVAPRVDMGKEVY